ncbi:MAG TPA: cupin domain-containing protein [Gemmatimonadaceae bacterium]|nr:cupin domain-containing protein [Gemmatimonadaceae bacterium]
MKLYIIPAAALSLAVVAAPALARAQVTDKVADKKMAPHSEPTWGPAPAVFPAGAQMAVLQGKPDSAGIFTVRLRFPDGYRIAPHTHPTDEYVTVISGKFRVGMGERADLPNAMTLEAGGFVTAPAMQAHYAAAEGMTVVQVTAMGPFALTYVNPADMPRQMDMPRTPEIPRPKPAP